MLHQQIASFRRVTPALLATRRHALFELKEDVSKSDLAMTLKRCAPVLKITGTPYQILDILLGLVRKEDLQAGKRPLVAISNEKLAEYSDRSKRTVSRCLKRLAEAGVLSFADSPNGRRFVRRDKAGAIDYGFGLDLTPACNRLSELNEMAAAFQEKLKQEKLAKRKTVAWSRAIKDVASMLGSEGAHLVEQVEDVLARPLDPFTRAEQVKVIYQDALNLEEKLSSKGDKNGVTLSNTTPSHPKDFVETKRNGSNDPSIMSSTDNSKNAVESAFENKHHGKVSGIQAADSERSRYSQTQSTPLPSSMLGGVSIGLLNTAAKEVRALLGYEFQSWSALLRSSDDLRHLIGLSEVGWDNACTAQGRHLSVACLLVVAEKALRDPEAISRPGGYFRAMIDRANANKLNLQKSVFGLVER